MADISHLLREDCTIVQRRPTMMRDRYGNPIMADTEIGAKTHIQDVTGPVGALTMGGKVPQDGVYYIGKAFFASETDILEDDVILARGKKFWANSVELHVSPIGIPMPYKSVFLRETQEREVVTNV